MRGLKLGLRRLASKRSAERPGKRNNLSVNVDQPKKRRLTERRARRPVSGMLNVSYTMSGKVEG